MRAGVRTCAGREDLCWEWLNVIENALAERNWLLRLASERRSTSCLLPSEASFLH